MRQKNSALFKLSILIPIYNEIAYLDEFTNRLKKSFDNEDAEYIFINDGSTDGSNEWLDQFVSNQKNKRNKLINLKRNCGKGKALQQGIKNSTGDYLLFQDADLELDTADSLEMFQIIKNNPRIECVFGSRYLTGKLTRSKNYLYKFVGKFNSFLFNILFNQSLSDVHCGTKIVSRKIIDNIKLTINDFGFEIDIASQIAKKKYKIYEFGISYYARSFKEGKKITWLDGIKCYYYLLKLRLFK